MNTSASPAYQPPRRLFLLSLFAQFSNQQTSGCLRVDDGTTTWTLYLEKGLVIYASNSLDPFGRLRRHLETLNQDQQILPLEVWEQVRLMFASSPDDDAPVELNDYKAICWLANQDYLSSSQVCDLIEALVKEVIGALLLVQRGTYKVTDLGEFAQLPHLCQFNLRTVAESFQKELMQQQAARRAPGRSSEPHLSQARRESSSKLTSKPMNQAVQSQAQARHQPTIGLPGTTSPNGTVVPQGSTRTTPYRIVCVDDSITILKAVEAFLDDSMFRVTCITEPVDALMEVIRSKPHLILLDITMPDLDGYEFCALLRRHESFKQLPIIMLTGNTGLIDRARAKLVRASDYLTKPFTQSDLIKILLKHLPY